MGNQRTFASVAWSTFAGVLLSTLIADEISPGAPSINQPPETHREGSFRVSPSSFDFSTIRASGPNGRAEFANGDFSRELRLTCPKVVFSATT